MDANQRQAALQEMIDGVINAMNELIARRGRVAKVSKLKNVILMYVRLAYIMGRAHAAWEFIEANTGGNGNGHDPSHSN